MILSLVRGGEGMKLPWVKCIRKLVSLLLGIATIQPANICLPASSCSQELVWGQFDWETHTGNTTFHRRRWWIETLHLGSYFLLSVLEEVKYPTTLHDSVLCYSQQAHSSCWSTGSAMHICDLRGLSMSWTFLLLSNQITYKNQTTH